MVLDELLAAFRKDVEAFARHQGIVDEARIQGVDFPPDVVERVVDEHRRKALDALSRVMNALPAVEGVRNEQLERLRAIEGERVDVEYALDGLELEQDIGKLDGPGFHQGEEGLRARLDALDDEEAACREAVERIGAVLDRWYDVGADYAITV